MKIHTVPTPILSNCNQPIYQIRFISYTGKTSQNIHPKYVTVQAFIILHSSNIHRNSIQIFVRSFTHSFARDHILPQLDHCHDNERDLHWLYGRHMFNVQTETDTDLPICRFQINLTNAQHNSFLLHVSAPSIHIQHMFQQHSRVMTNQCVANLCFLRLSFNTFCRGVLLHCSTRFHLWLLCWITTATNHMYPTRKCY